MKNQNFDKKLHKVNRTILRDKRKRNPAFDLSFRKKERRKVYIDRRLFRNDRNGGGDRVRDKRGGEREIRKKVEQCWDPDSLCDRCLIGRVSFRKHFNCAFRLSKICRLIVHVSFDFPTDNSSLLITTQVTEFYHRLHPTKIRR